MLSFLVAINLRSNLEMSDTLLGEVSANRIANFFPSVFKSKFLLAGSFNKDFNTISISHVYWYLGREGLFCKIPLNNCITSGSWPIGRPSI